MTASLLITAVPIPEGWPSSVISTRVRVGNQVTATLSVEQGSSPAPSLVTLVERTAEGDGAAFKRLYQATSPSTFLQVKKYVWAWCEAEEVLQQVYLKVWNGAGQYDPRISGVATWIARVARNAAIDHLRRNEARTSVELPVRREFDDAGATSPEDELPSCFPSPEELLCQRQTKDWMESLLRQLPARQRQCLLLAVQDGLSGSEIAALSGVPLGTVKSWMRRGLQTLKVLMERQVDGSVEPRMWRSDAEMHERSSHA